MASRFDDSSSGSSEDEEEAPQLDGMTSSDDEAFEGPFGDVYDDLDADVLEVRKGRRAKERERATMLDSPLASKNINAHRFLPLFLALSLFFSSPTTPMMTIRHQK